MAVANYEAANNHFPPAFVLGPDGTPWHSWRVLILPYIEGDAIFKAYKFDEPWNGPNNSRLADRMPRMFAFTGSHRTGLTTTNYLAVVGQETMWPGAKPRKREEIKDGPGDTILIVENNGLGVHWMEPRDLAFDSMEFAFDSPNGISSWYQQPSVVTVEGAVRMLSPKTTHAGLRASLTVTGGENPPDEERGWTVIPDGRDRERKP